MENVNNLTKKKEMTKEVKTPPPEKKPDREEPQLKVSKEFQKNFNNLFESDPENASKDAL